MLTPCPHPDCAPIQPQQLPTLAVACIGVPDPGDVATCMQETFYADLNAFLATPVGGRYVGDIVFQEPVTPESTIYTARSSFQLQYLEDTSDQVRAVHFNPKLQCLLPLCTHPSRKELPLGCHQRRSVPARATRVPLVHMHASADPQSTYVARRVCGMRSMHVVMTTSGTQQ